MAQFSLPQNSKIEVGKYYKNTTSSKNIKKVHTIYVVNNNNKLLGTMSLKRLLISNKDTKVRDIVNSDVYYVKTDIILNLIIYHI